MIPRAPFEEVRGQINRLKQGRHRHEPKAGHSSMLGRDIRARDSIRSVLLLGYLTKVSRIGRLRPALASRCFPGCLQKATYTVYPALAIATLAIPFYR